MKKTLLLLLMTAACSMMLFNSCSKESKIVGAWKCVSSDYSRNTPPDGYHFDHAEGGYLFSNYFYGENDIEDYSMEFTESNVKIWFSYYPYTISKNILQIDDDGDIIETEIKKLTGSEMVLSKTKTYYYKNDAGQTWSDCVTYKYTFIKM